MEEWRRAKRFWADVDQCGPDECWLWHGLVAKGYGRTGWGAKPNANSLAHRVAYELAVGPIPKGWHVHHTCTPPTPRCCNPAHLEAKEPRAHREHHATRRRPRTHCRRGHPFEGDNLIIRETDGARLCRICAEAREARRAGTKERKAQAAAAARKRRQDPEYAAKMREYQRQWAARKRETDPDFAERERTASREYQRRKRSDRGTV